MKRGFFFPYKAAAGPSEGAQGSAAAQQSRRKRLLDATKKLAHNTLRELRLKRSNEKPCLTTKAKMTLFFFYAKKDGEGAGG